MSNIIAKIRSRPGLAAAAFVALLAGGGAIAAVASDCEREELAAPATPVRIGTLATTTSAVPSAVAVRGRIAERFGSHVVLDDGSGRLLVDTGGGDAASLAVGQALTASGRYRDGVLHARRLVGADGRAVTVRGDRHRGGHDARRHDRRDAAERAPAAAPATATRSVPADAANEAAPAR